MGTVTLAARNALLNQIVGGSSLIRGRFAILRTNDVTPKYRIFTQFSVTSSTTESPYIRFNFIGQAPATETYNRVYLCGSVGEYAVNDEETLQQIIDNTDSTIGPVLDPNSGNTITIAYGDITPTTYEEGQYVNPTIEISMA